MILLRYVLRNHAVPFLFSGAALMGIFLLQFMMKSADRIIGKGLDLWTIIQLVMYNLAWMVVLVVPMSVLVATLMAFGNMSQNNEITIMKASGISLPRMIFGPMVASVFLALGLVYFNNQVLPDANHKAKVLMFDISQKKPTLSLQPGVFSQELNNISILARNIDQGTNRMYGITIYDYANPSKINIITAKSGKIYFTPDVTKLVLDLQEGEIHEPDASGTAMYRKVIFTNHRIAMDANQFSLRHSNNISRGDREMSAAEMMRRVDSLRAIGDMHEAAKNKEMQKVFYGDASARPFLAPPDRKDKNQYFSRIGSQLSNLRSSVFASISRVDMVQKDIDRFMVEVYKKYSIPTACIIFILLGAPLGVMMKKGGFGMAGSISLFFFLLYWAFLIGGEKLADRGMVTPFWGMWSANVVMGILGVVLLYRSTRETVTFDLTFFRGFIPKYWRVEEGTADEN